jgi:hypothetical protein
MKRCQSSANGLILTWEMIARIVPASACVAGRSEILPSGILAVIAGNFCVLFTIRQGDQNNYPLRKFLDKTSV